MSALSFREQAAIAIFAVAPSGSDADDTPTDAQNLADACCAKWGHDERWDRVVDGTALKRCARCGAEVTP